MTVTDAARTVEDIIAVLLSPAGGADPSLVLLAATGVVGLAHGIRSGDVGGQPPRAVGDEFGQLPTVLVLIGLTVAPSQATSRRHRCDDSGR